jgi:hypothetical protein
MKVVSGLLRIFNNFHIFELALLHPKLCLKIMPKLPGGH